MLNPAFLTPAWGPIFGSFDKCQYEVLAGQRKNQDGGTNWREIGSTVMGRFRRQLLE